MSDRGEWRQMRRDSNRVMRFGIGWALAIIALVAVVSVGVWYFKVTTSDIKGQGDAVQIKNDGKNRVLQQQKFNDLYQAVQRLDRQINDAKTAWDAAPSDATLRTNYNGLVSQCQTTVGDYNSLARQYTAAEFRDLDLPIEINMNDPLTDCKPNTPLTPEASR